MVKQCPHCQEKLNLSATQLAKVEAALTQLADGNLLKLSCPHCKRTMELAEDGELAFSNRSGTGTPVLKQRKLHLRPPRPPKLDWLAGGKSDEQDMVRDAQEVLLLMAEGQARETVVDAFTETGYDPVFPKSARDGIERMRFINYAAVVLHTRYEGNTLEESVFHAHMRKLVMGRRRSIFYTLIGPEFQTLYNLEALGNSANLVINDKDLKHCRTILKKAIPEYETFFKPYVETLTEVGNSEGSIWADVRRKRRTRVESDILKDLLSIQ